MFIIGLAMVTVCIFSISIWGATRLDHFYRVIVPSRKVRELQRLIDQEIELTAVAYMDFETKNIKVVAMLTETDIESNETEIRVRKQIEDIASDNVGITDPIIIQFRFVKPN